ncbi:MAG: hypothetical protein ACYC2H_03630 [Thermoplasmatota archaeon]
MRLAVLLVIGLVLAGCASTPATTPAPEATADPMESLAPGTRFAYLRHCTAVDFYARAVVPDLVDQIPLGWSTPTPGIADLRVVLLRCVETMAMLLTVSLRAGAPTDDAPLVDYVLQVLTNSTVDDWPAMGAPVTRAECTYSSPAEADIWTVTTPDLAVRLEVSPVGLPGVQHGANVQYAAGDPVVWSWGAETAILTRTVQGTISFGPASVLANAQVVSVLDATASERWSAVNAEYRTGMVP